MYMSTCVWTVGGNQRNNETSRWWKEIDFIVVMAYWRQLRAVYWLQTCPKRFCWQVLWTSFCTTHKTPEYARENVSQRSEVTAKLSITAALVRHWVPQLCPCSLNPSISKTGADVHLQALGTGAGGSTIVQMPSLREIGTVGGGGRGGGCLLARCNTSPLCSPPPPIDLLKDPGYRSALQRSWGSHFVSWIWKSATLWGPSGQTYWTPNKRACWEGAY